MLVPGFIPPIPLAPPLVPGLPTPKTPIPLDPFPPGFPLGLPPIKFPPWFPWPPFGPKPPTEPLGPPIPPNLPPWPPVAPVKPEPPTQPLPPIFPDTPYPPAPPGPGPQPDERNHSWRIELTWRIQQLWTHYCYSSEPTGNKPPVQEFPLNTETVNAAEVKYEGVSTTFSQSCAGANGEYPPMVPIFKLLWRRAGETEWLEKVIQSGRNGNYANTSSKSASPQKQTIIVKSIQKDGAFQPNPSPFEPKPREPKPLPVPIKPAPLPQPAPQPSPKPAPEPEPDFDPYFPSSPPTPASPPKVPPTKPADPPPNVPPAVPSPPGTPTQPARPNPAPWVPGPITPPSPFTPPAPPAPGTPVPGPGTPTEPSPNPIPIPVPIPGIPSPVPEVPDPNTEPVPGFPDPLPNPQPSPSPLPGPEPEPSPIPLPLEPGITPLPTPIPLPNPTPGPAPGTPQPTPQPTPEPTPGEVPTNPGATPTPTPTIPVTGTDPDGSITPTPSPWPTPTNPGTHFPTPGAPGVTPGGTRPDIANIAAEVGRIEQKVARLANNGGGLADWLWLLPLLRDFFESDIPGTTYKLTGVCEVPDADGNQPEAEFEAAAAKNLGAIINRLDTMDQMLQQHLAWKTPTCKTTFTPTGDWRTISFISDEVSPYGSARLRKRFRYRSTSGLGLGEVIDHWKSFTWQAGPVCVQHADASWGTPQCWASTADEGKRVIRHAAGEAGIDPDQDGRWVISGSNSARVGVSGTMRVNTKGGYYWITARDGSEGRPIVGTVDSNP